MFGNDHAERIGHPSVLRADVPLKPGTLINLPAGLPHGIAAAKDSRMVVIYTVCAGYTSVRPEGRPDEAGIAIPGEYIKK